jgi:hypothetical protein
MSHLERKFTEAAKRAAWKKRLASFAAANGDRDAAASFLKAAEFWEARAAELGDQIDQNPGGSAS